MQPKNKDSASPAPWDRFETLLLDMDGTILDLAFDNYFWRELVPRCFARDRGIDESEAMELIFGRYAGKEGTLDWYCLDYWSAELGLNLVALKAASSQRIRYLPGAREFLATARRQRIRVVLVTNAHRHSLQIKAGVAGLSTWFEQLVTSHDYGRPKEHPEFWSDLQRGLNFNPDTTLFVDDSLPVLDAALEFGIQRAVAVRRPDTRKPPKDTGSHHYVDGVGDWAIAAAESDRL
jgi:putative hydrolase of the HAD superfamily